MADRINATLSRRSKYKYVELTQKIMRDMARRGLKAGDRLGTEAELAEAYGISRITVRQALSLLEQDGFIRRQQKKGTFVQRAVDSTHHLMLIRGTALVVIQNDLSLDPAEDLAAFTVFRALERELTDRGFTVRVMGLGSDPKQDYARLKQALSDEDLEGICAIGPCLEPFRPLIRSVPVAVSATFHPIEGLWVGLDMRRVIDESTAYLLERGHRDVALVCGPWVDQAGMADMAQGYRQAHESRNLPYRRERIYQAFRGESLKELAEQILSSPQRPTAVVAEDWRVCHAVLAAAQSLGLSVPQDLSLIGCGQNVLSIQLPVPVTTYLPDSEGAGRTLARILTDLIDGKGSPDGPVWIHGRIVERESVRPL